MFPIRPNRPGRIAGFALFIVIVTSIAAGCGRSDAEAERAETLSIYAAASTTDLLTAIADAFERRTGTRVDCNFASSSTLARQIEHGARADVYISANPRWMDHLERLGAIEAGSRFDWLTNELVLVAPADDTFEVEMRADFFLAGAFEGPLAIGNPDHVPAGIYAKQALVALDWWPRLEDRIIPTVDVRAALRLVELGEASAGIVYASDARASDRVTILASFPTAMHDPICYPAAVCRDAGPDATAFITFLQSTACDALITEHGFRRSGTDA
jgi:molybdate transport system substrate-binding protein